MNESATEYLSRIGRLGGQSKSEKKLRAVRRNLKKARKQKAAK